jgi:hypothetical protein
VSLLAEYADANTVYLTYDGYRRQAGSFLVAGVFVYWGFVMSAAAPTSVVTLSSLFVAALMSCWYLFANHYRQLYMWKLARLHKIERQLGMQQHLRFIVLGKSGIKSGSHGPRGHNLDGAVYVLTSIGGPAISRVRDGFSWWSLLVIPLVTVICLVVARNERASARDRLVDAHTREVSTG